MFLKKYNATSSGLRHRISRICFKFKKIKKHFIVFNKKNSIKNNLNKKCFISKKGFYNKNKTFLLNNKRLFLRNLSCLLNIFNINFKKPFIGLIKFANGSFSYINLQHGCFIGQFIKTSYSVLNFFETYYPGSIIPLKFLNSSIIFSNISLVKKDKIQYAKSPGTFCKFINYFNELNIISIKLPTGTLKYVSSDIFVTLGRNSNILKSKVVFGKAGISLMMGKKQKVRGVAMNPVDHPHGGRTKTNKPEVSPWGWVTKKNH
uniref:ribosomal protein L2 n=1 Tax=Cryptocaryon irritans TaxID=153251 RepID=UPI0022FD6467|nr:ribosomal protein L2 [Cryptocaryon irritans]WBP62316.1 ribosomal protein L2 [Cryptocaryon irritans]